jgi:PAS domain S-box-containing protein
VNADPTEPVAEATPHPARDPAVTRIALLLVAVALLSIAIGYAPGWSVTAGQRIHLVLETASTTLALVIGSLSLLRFSSGRRTLYLLIGAAFLWVTGLDAIHAVSFAVDPVGLPGPVYRVFAWSWLASRTYLALFLWVALVDGRMEVDPPPRETSLFLLSGLGVLLALVSATLIPGGSGGGPPLIPRPLELIPGGLFALTAIRLLQRPAWLDDVFHRWLVQFLLVAAAGHLVYAARSPGVYDLLFTGAHLLKLLSYGAILTGVLAGARMTFRREAEALDALREMNETMGLEVADRRGAEADPKQSEERLRSFLDSAHDLVLSTDPHGAILYVNPAWERTLGYSAHASAGLRLTEVVAPDQRERVEERFAEILETAGTRTLEIEFTAKDGRRVVCSGSATVHSEDGRPVAVQAILQDVSPQRDAETELAASRAKLAAVVESTGDSIWSVDREMRLVTFNTAFALALEARTGREAAVGDPPEALFETDNAAWYRDLYGRALRGERFSELKSEMVVGHERLFEIFCHPITGTTGISGAVMFGKDVTRRVRAEEALRMAKEEAEGANRAKSQFLANMSHELRTPLNSVIGFTNILLKNKDGTLGDRELGFLDRVLANGRHLLSLINEVLDLAKIEAGRMELEVAPVPIPALVAETVSQLEGQAREKEVELGWEAPAGLVDTETDAAKLRQVLINLIGNALKFSAGGRVTVRVLAEGDEVRGIAVEDTGVGIPRERLEAIFEAFQQADGSTTREYGGTGLGLAISRSICQLLGYDLEVESEVGSGSTFTIRMAGGARPSRPGEDALHPADQHPAPHPPNPSIQADEGPDGQGLAVLVVDDESDSRVLMAHHLRDLGCRVFTAASGQEGLDLARGESPDLITLDLMMPDMSGWEVLHALKNDTATRGIPVVVVSIVAEESRGRLLGAVDLLTKPVERADLLRVLWRNRIRNQGPRVLLVDDDEADREELAAALRARGIEVSTAPNGREALRKVQDAAPDAVVLNFVTPVMDGTTFLNRLRKNRYHTGLPVVVLTDRELTRSEEVALQEKAHSVVPKGREHRDELLRVLGWILPLPETVEPPT